MRKLSLCCAVGIFALAACAFAAATPPDASPVFGEIDKAIEVHDFLKANSLLGQLMDSLLATGVPPLVGQAHRRAMDAGRENRDLIGLVRQARLTWLRAMREEQAWSQVMVDLSIAFASSVTLDAALPPALRYQQARARYEAAPSITLLHQLTLRAFEAGEYEDTSKYIAEERKQIPRAYSEHAGPILARLETLEGLVELKMGNVAAAIEALDKSGAALKQYQGNRLIGPPPMLLAKELLQLGRSAPVLAYLDICAQFEYPGGEEYTDEGRNPSSPAQLKSAILAGGKPQFSPGTLQIY
jgi:hypothetical protein